MVLARDAATNWLSIGCERAVRQPFDGGDYVRTRPLGVVLLAQLISSAFTAPAFGSSVYSVSRVDGPGGTFYATGEGATPGQSSVSHGYIEVFPTGSFNYGTEAEGAGAFGRFSLFTFAGGSQTGDAHVFVSSRSDMYYNDSITVSGGTGLGTVRIPFLVEGSVTLATSSSARFGFTFCQSIPTGSPTGGVACSVNGQPPYDNDQPPNVAFLSSAPNFSQLFNLDFAVPFGVPYDLNFTVTLHSGAGGLVASSTADFSHTGIAQPAQVFDALGTLIPNATIVAASGFDYVTAVPEPGGFILSCTGMLVLLTRRAWRATSHP